MRIKEVRDEYLEFDNGMTITSDWGPDCCEYNYAAFEEIDTLAMNWDFDPNNIIFEPLQEQGFRFGNPNKMVFVPCYSEQNGYYTEELDIYFNGKLVIGDLTCEFVDR